MTGWIQSNRNAGGPRCVVPGRGVCDTMPYTPGNIQGSEFPVISLCFLTTDPRPFKSHAVTAMTISQHGFPLSLPEFQHGKGLTNTKPSVLWKGAHPLL